MEEQRSQERREGMHKLTEQIETLVKNQGVIKYYLENQFGGVDLAGNPVEGNITRQLRELNEKVKIQNGRVTKSEDKVDIMEKLDLKSVKDKVEILWSWRFYVLGGCAVVALLIGLHK